MLSSGGGSLCRTSAALRERSEQRRLGLARHGCITFSGVSYAINYSRNIGLIRLFYFMFIFQEKEKRFYRNGTKTERRVRGFRYPSCLERGRWVAGTKIPWSTYLSFRSSTYLAGEESMVSPTKTLVLAVNRMRAKRTEISSSTTMAIGTSITVLRRSPFVLIVPRRSLSVLHPLA
jgi:hypothetical protein